MFQTKLIASFHHLCMIQALLEIQKRWNKLYTKFKHIVIYFVSEKFQSSKLMKLREKSQDSYYEAPDVTVYESTTGSILNELLINPHMSRCQEPVLLLWPCGSPHLCQKLCSPDKHWQGGICSMNQFITCNHQSSSMTLEQQQTSQLQFGAQKLSNHRTLFSDHQTNRCGSTWSPRSRFEPANLNRKMTIRNPLLNYSKRD